MNIKKIGIFAAMFLAVISLSACGKKKTTSSSSSLPPINAKLPSDNINAKDKAAAASKLAFDQYFNSLTAQINKTIKPELTTGENSNYSDVVVTQDGNSGLIITYTLNQTYTLSDSDLNTIRSNLKGLNSSIIQGMTQSKVINPALRFIVVNGDGSQVINEMVTS